MLLCMRYVREFKRHKFIKDTREKQKICTHASHHELFGFTAWNVCKTWQKHAYKVKFFVSTSRIILISSKDICLQLFSFSLVIPKNTQLGLIHFCLKCFHFIFIHETRKTFSSRKKSKMRERERVNVDRIWKSFLIETVHEYKFLNYFQINPFWRCACEGEKCRRLPFIHMHTK